MEDKIRALHTEQELAMLRADLAISSPQSYTLDEMRSISEDLDVKTEALDDAIRADFDAMPPEVRARMFQLLNAAGGFEEGFWERLLL